MATARFSQRRIESLKPRNSAYDIPRPGTQGFRRQGSCPPAPSATSSTASTAAGGSGRSSVRCGSIGVDEARERARVMLASIRNSTDEQAAAPQDTAFETSRRRGVSGATPATGNPQPSRSTGTTTATIFCPGSRDARSATSSAHDVKHWFASLHNTPVSADRSDPNPVGHHAPKPRSTATGPKEPIHARASGDIVARGGSASCPLRKSADWTRCWLATKPVTRRLSRSYDCFSSPAAARVRSSL